MYNFCRSSYFPVTDEVAFREVMGALNLTVFTATGDSGPVFGVHPTDMSDGWPTTVDLSDHFAEDGTFTAPAPLDALAAAVDDPLVDVEEIVRHFLVPGHVAVLQSVHADRLRSIGGFAVAIDHTGASVTVDLQSEILARAAAAFPGQTITAPSH